MPRKRKQKRSRKTTHHKGGDGGVFKQMRESLKDALYKRLIKKEDKEKIKEGEENSKRVKGKNSYETCIDDVCSDMLHDELKLKCKDDCRQDGYYKRQDMINNCQPLLDARNKCFVEEGKLYTGSHLDIQFCDREECIERVDNCQQKCSEKYEEYSTEDENCKQNCRYPCSIERYKLFTCRKRPIRLTYSGKRITRRRKKLFKKR